MRSGRAEGALNGHWLVVVLGLAAGALGVNQVLEVAQLQGDLDVPAAWLQLLPRSSR